MIKGGVLMDKRFLGVSSIRKDWPSGIFNPVYCILAWAAREHLYTKVK